jgi:hypothetical protein
MLELSIILLLNKHCYLYSATLVEWREKITKAIVYSQGLRVLSMYDSISERFQRSLRPILNGWGKPIFSSLTHTQIVDLEAFTIAKFSYYELSDFMPSINSIFEDLDALNFL